MPGLCVFGRWPTELVGGDELAGLGVHAFDVGLQLTRLDPPLATAADLDRRKLTGADQGVDLRGRGVQDVRHVGQLEKARSVRSTRHSRQYAVGYAGLTADAQVLVGQAVWTTPAPRLPAYGRMDLSTRRPLGPLQRSCRPPDREGDQRVTELPAPAANRLPRARWLDARLLVGLLLVLLSVVLGAKLVADADERVRVWSLTRDLGPDVTLTEDDVDVASCASTRPPRVTCPPNRTSTAWSSPGP